MFTCTNGLKFLAICDTNIQIQSVESIFAWGTSKINMYELENFLNKKITLPRHFYHALDVVDGQWGDNSRYHYEYLQQHTGPVRVIAMAHGCVGGEFVVPIQKLTRKMTTPYGICSIYDYKDFFSLFPLFDLQDPKEFNDAFESRMLAIIARNCADIEPAPKWVHAMTKSAKKVEDYKATCQALTELYNKVYTKGQRIMQRNYGGTGFTPIYMGYEESGKWNYVNLLAHIEHPLFSTSGLNLDEVLNICGKCSECTLVDLSCAEPCPGSEEWLTGHPDAMETMGGRKRKSKKKPKKKKRGASSRKKK